MFSNEQLRKMIVPLVIEQILVMLVGMADVMMVSYAGEAAISGVSLINMFGFMIITILTSLAVGGAVIVSQYLGNKELEKASLTSSQLVMINSIASVVIALICLFFNRGIIRLFFGAIEPDVMEAASQYFFMIALSFPFLGIYNAVSALFRSLGKTNVTMYVSLLMNTINIIGNALGIFVFDMGIMGIAYATLISRIIAGVVQTALAFSHKNDIYLKWKDILQVNREYTKRIIRIAVPNGIENGLFALGRVLVTGIVAMFGTTQIAVNGVANSINMVPIIVVNAINIAVVTVVGQCVGAKAFEQAKQYLLKLMKISYVSTFILGTIVNVSISLILNLYDLSPETYRISVILIVSHNILALLLHPTSFNLPNGIRAAGDVRFTMIVGIASMLLFRLGTGYLFGVILNLGIYGVWIAMGTDWFMRSIVFVLRYRSGKWTQYRAI